MNGDSPTTLSKDSRGYTWFVNLFASIVLVIIWKGCAWLLAVKAPSWMGLGLTEDHWFMMFVAMALALHLPDRRTAHEH